MLLSHTAKVFARTGPAAPACALLRANLGGKTPSNPDKPTLSIVTKAKMASGASAPGEADRLALGRFCQLIPKLGGNHKGAHGKVAVVGGCLEFTGAPFFAAMSALKVGADMAYVICTPSAAGPLKAYSPELMVLPYLPEAGEEEGPMDESAVLRSVSRTAPWLSRASCVVVGPGLGSDPAVVAAAVGLVREAVRRGLPLVVDGSALSHLVTKHPDCVRGYTACLLTPNVAELGRIAECVGLRLPGGMSDAWLEHAPRVAQAFCGPVVLAKGPEDVLCGPGGGEGSGGGLAGGGQQEAPPPPPLYTSRERGSLRRCGGLGDVLAGTAAAFLGWAAKHAAATQRGEQRQPQTTANPGGAGPAPAAPCLDSATVALCGYAASRVVRHASAAAYDKSERSMLAGDVIAHLYPSFKELTGGP